MFEKNIKWFNKKTNKQKTHFLYMTKRFGKIKPHGFFQKIKHAV